MVYMSRQKFISFGGLASLPIMRECRTRRESSWDRTGGNRDFIVIKPKETAIIANLKGPACIRHIWMTGGARELYFLRKVLLRMYWDGETKPSVESPLGDFFGLGHGIPYPFISLPLTAVGRGDRLGLNCYFPMPFNKSAKIEIINECNTEMVLYYHIDYEVYEEEFDESVLRFHAKWRREVCKKVRAKVNLTGEDNYLVLYAEGSGHYIGCVLNVKALEPGWWGEGDDMIFIDGEKWPPSLHGTGTEDYFCSAYGFGWQHYGPYHGVIQVGNVIDWTGRWTVYRFHIEDPIVFKKSIKVTIEHGHANDRGDEWSSVAYWYQVEPHIEFTKIPPVEERLPMP